MAARYSYGMTQTHTVDFTTEEQAKLVFETVAPHAGSARREGTTVEMDDAGISYLRALPGDAYAHVTESLGYERVHLPGAMGWHAYRVDSERAGF